MKFLEKGAMFDGFNIIVFSIIFLLLLSISGCGAVVELAKQSNERDAREKKARFIGRNEEMAQKCVEFCKPYEAIAFQSNTYDCVCKLGQ